MLCIHAVCIHEELKSSDGIRTNLIENIALWMQLEGICWVQLVGKEDSRRVMGRFRQQQINWYCKKART